MQQAVSERTPPQVRTPLRQRVLPTSVLGLTMLVLLASLGAAFSGAVLYAYYDYRLSKSEDRVAKFVVGFDKRFKSATQLIDAEREQAKSQIRKELEPLQRVTAEGSTLEALLKKVSASLWFVRTLDEAGQPAVGSAFVVASDSEQTYLLGAYSTIRAATRQPGPQVFVRHGDEEVKATLWSWQEERDLALLIVPKANQPRLQWATDTPTTRTGERIFAVSGLGASGGAITQGFVADVSSAGIQHDAPIGPSFQGGPLLNSKAEVLGISSRAYSPLGFGTESVFFGVPIRNACDKILRCPGGGGGDSQPGQRR
jgi:S1-C subfamily serine protease